MTSGRGEEETDVTSGGVAVAGADAMGSCLLPLEFRLKGGLWVDCKRLTDIRPESSIRGRRRRARPRGRLIPGSKAVKSWSVTRGMNLIEWWYLYGILMSLFLSISVSGFRGWRVRFHGAEAQPEGGGMAYVPPIIGCDNLPRRDGARGGCHASGDWSGGLVRGSCIAREAACRSRLSRAGFLGGVGVELLVGSGVAEEGSLF